MSTLLSLAGLLGAVWALGSFFFLVHGIIFYACAKESEKYVGRLYSEEEIREEKARYAAMILRCWYWPIAAFKQLRTMKQELDYYARGKR